MMQTLWRWWRAPLFSPIGFVVRAAVLLVAFGVAHLAGGRDCTSILCGTSPTGNLMDRYAFVFGLIYVLLYFAAVLVVPILLIAAALLSLLTRWSDPNS
jgi:hypothetical protein